MYGNTHVTGIVFNGRYQKKLKFLNSTLSNSRAFANKATYTTWLHYFEMGKRKNTPYQVEAMLSYWVVVPCLFERSRRWLQSYVFLVAILLTGEKRLALSPLYLGFFIWEILWVCSMHHCVGGKVLFNVVPWCKVPSDVCVGKVKDLDSEIEWNFTSWKAIDL